MKTVYVLRFSHFKTGQIFSHGRFDSLRDAIAVQRHIQNKDWNFNAIIRVIS